MKKQQVFYIHGGEWYNNYDDFLERLQIREIRDLPSSPKYVKWTKKLADDLGEDYEVFLPQMPNGMNAKYVEWKIWFERHFEYLADDVIFIGCSLGAMFLYKYFIENTTPFNVKALFLMAAPLPELVPVEEKDSGDFVYKTSDIGSICTKAEQLFILHSKDDFLVPYEHALKYKEALPKAELVTFTDKNHFLVEELPELVDLIKKI